MEKPETHENVKKKRPITLIVLLLVLIATFIAIAGFAYAKYRTSRSGTATAQVAEFHFELKNINGDSTATSQSGTIQFPITRTDGNANVQEGLLAPETYGRFDMIIDTKGTQVSYRYDIDVTVTNCPSNLIFYTDKEHNNPITPTTRTGAGTEQDPKIATFRISKYVPLNRANEEHKEIVYWNWPYETGTGDAIHTNDLIDSADMAKTVTMAIVASASQVNGQPVGVPTVGEQTTSVKDIVEIDLPAPGGQQSVTINKGSQANVNIVYTETPPPENLEAISVQTSDSSVATATFNTSTNKVVINALKAGTATITLRGERSWDLIGTVEVTVQSTVSDFSLSSDNSTVDVARNTTGNVTITNFANLSPMEQFTISSSNNNIATATYDDNGTITITAGANPGTATITLTGSSSNTTKTIDVRVPLQIGDTVNYSTSLNGVTLNNWNVFYKEGDYTYIILGDYLPNAAVDISNIETDTGTYSVYTNENRITLLNAMTTKSNWDSLLSGTLNGTAVNLTRNDNIWAMGAPTIDLWVNSWNSLYPSDRLYIAQTESPMKDGLYGTCIGLAENPTASGVDLSGKTGFGNLLYFPHHESVENVTSGYWIASPGSKYNNTVLDADYTGYVVRIFPGDTGYAFRPVICLPNNIFE